MEGLVSDHYYRIILAMVAAAVLACAFTIFTATAGPAEDNARIAIGPACAQQAWPYFDAHCLRDLRPQIGQRKSLRTVTTERW